MIVLADPDENGHDDLYGMASDGSTSPMLLNGELGAGGDVVRAAFTSDGEYVIYLADQDANELFELYSVPADGSAAPVKLNGALVTGGDVARTDGEPFLITPDGARVVYRADQDVDGVVELYSVASDGSAAPVRLAAGLSSSLGVTQHAIRADGATVVFLTDAASDYQRELFHVPIDGSAPPTKLNGPLGAGRVWSFRLTSDGMRVLYSTQQVGGWYLYSVSPSGGVPVNLSALDEFAWFADTPDSSHVVYEGPQHELWSVPIAGGTPTLLSDQAIGWSNIAISLGGQRVIYLADENGIGLFSVPIDGSAAPVRLNAPVPANGYIGSFQTGPAGRVVYFASMGEDANLYTVPEDASSAPVRLDGPSVPGEYIQSFVLEAGGTRVVFRKGFSSASELYSVPIDAGAPPTALTDLQFCNDHVIEARSIAGGRVVYHLETSGGSEIHAVPIAGGVPPTLLFRPPSSAEQPSDVRAFDFTPNGSKLIYMADPDIDEAVSLFSVDLRGDGVVKRIDSASGSPCGDVVSFLLEPSGQHVVYVSDQRQDTTYELLRADLANGTDPVVLSSPLVSGGSLSTRAGDYAISPDGVWVVYITDGPVNVRIGLFSVPLDANSPPILLHFGLPSTTYVSGFVISPTSSHVVYGVVIGGRQEIFSVPIDGSALPVHLNALEPRPSAYNVSPDGLHVVFTANTIPSYYAQLYVVPIDGSSPAVRLNGEQHGGSFLISPDGAHIVFAYDGLFSVPIDASAEPRELSSVGVGHLKGRWLSPDGTRVIYLADEIVDGRDELFMVPLDGSAPPERLSPNLVVNGDVVFVTLAPDSSRVVLVADAQADQVFELYSAPLDGRRPAVKLNPPLAYNGDIEYESMPPRIQADCRGVVYAADQSLNSWLELYRVAIDGSSGSVKLNGQLTVGGDLSEPGFRVSPSGAAVAYAADQEQDGVVELFLSTPGAPTHSKESDPP